MARHQREGGVAMWGGGVQVAISAQDG
jgi:hypothetical protein